MRPHPWKQNWQLVLKTMNKHYDVIIFSKDAEELKRLGKGLKWSFLSQASPYWMDDGKKAPGYYRATPYNDTSYEIFSSVN